MVISINRFYKHPHVTSRATMRVTVKLIGFQKNGYHANGDGVEMLSYQIMVNEGSKAIENVKLLEKYIRNVDKV